MASLEPKKIKRLLIANRGEIACRIIRTCKQLGITAVSIYTEVDTTSRHIAEADEAYKLSLSHAPLGYLDISAICSLAKMAGVDAIHPGYGFLSENADFAKAVLDAGLIFIGPSPESIKLAGDKIAAKELAHKVSVKCVPGFEIEENPSEQQIQAALDQVSAMGLPVLVKAAGGGGGRGMRPVLQARDLEPGIRSATREAKQLFGNGKLFIEKLVYPARHVEVQIIGDQSGQIRHLFDRDCSIQRRHQKIIEEAPAPNLPDKLKQELFNAATKLLSGMKYYSLATVEFLVDRNNDWYFLEVNSRLQVEHPVTESILDLDLVELQIKIAEGNLLSELLPDKLTVTGHSIEFRLCAEDAWQNFQPTAGVLQKIEMEACCEGLRFDSGYTSGQLFKSEYDSLIGKLIVTAQDRNTAITNSIKALEQFTLSGVPNNIGFLLHTLKSDIFMNCEHHITATEQLATTFKMEELVALLAGISVLDQINKLNDYQISHATTLNDEFKLCGMVYKTSIKVLSKSSCDIAVGNYSLQLELLDSQTYKLNNSSYRYSCSKFTELNFWISCHLGSYRLEKHFPTLKTSTSSDQSSDSKITAPLPGKIISCLVKNGDQVEKDQALVLIESMKMEHVVKAPRAGKVESVLVDSNQIVEASQLLLELNFE